jgi:hypothetical protein
MANFRPYPSPLITSSGWIYREGNRWEPVTGKRGLLHDRRKPISRVAILQAGSYAARLDTILADGLRVFHLTLRGKTVLLKPNLVEHIPGAEVNTNPLLVGAAADAFSNSGQRRSS